MIIKPNSQLEAEERAATESKVSAEQAARGESEKLVAEQLAGYLRKKWDAAKRSKTMTVESQMFINIRQATNKYDPAKLSAIREMGGSEVYTGITNTKCRNAIAWIRDILFQPGTKPFGISPTPSPELPPETMQELTSKFVHETMQTVMQQMTETSQELDMATVMAAIQAELPAMKEDLNKLVRSEAAKKAEEMEREINDKLVEGGWYDAMAEALYDIVVVNNGFLKGPIYRNRSKHKVVKGEDGKSTVQIIKEVVAEYERRSPFSIYPEPDSSSVEDGYLFDHVPYRRRELSAMIGVDGYNETEIRAVLKEHTEGGLREWTGIETERATLENKDTASVYQSDKIDALEYYGPVPGKILAQFGIAGLPDEDIDYEVSATMIGRHVIRAVINDDPMGRKPYAMAGYEKEPDSFWFRALPQKISDAQSVCNACARAVVNNIGMGSGPQVEINIDRLKGGAAGDTRIVPWKKWLTTNRMQQTGNAINFWQASMHAQEIMTVFKDFSKLADEHSGVPSFAHGDPQVGGAGNTASGLSMLISQAARAIKDVVGNVDRYMTVPSITHTYEELIMQPKYLEFIGDIKLVAKGSTALIEKEQYAQRMLEVLNATNNPMDTSITGVEGRAYMLGEVVKSHNIDPDKALAGFRKAGFSKEPTVPSASVLQAGGLPQNPNLSGGTPPNAAELDAAGNPVSGQNAQLVTGQGGEPALPPG